MTTMDADTSLLKPTPPTAEQLQSFLQRHLTLLLAERQAELDESHLLLSSVSPRVLERNGLALCRLGVLNTTVGMGGKTLVELHRPTAYHSEAKFPPHTFRSGDVVALVDEDVESSKKGKGTTKDTTLDAVVTRVTDVKIIVALASRRNKDADSQQLPTRSRLVKVANQVTWDRMEKNLVRLAVRLGIPVRTSRGMRGGSASQQDGRDREDDDDSSDDDDTPTNTSSIPPTTALPPAPSAVSHVPHLLRVLLALEQPQALPPPASLPAPPLPLFNPSLNPSQTSALSRALATRDIHLIHGPPGTGKTTLLVELILQLVLGKGERVLVTGSSNLAVDNLAAKLIEYRKGREKALKPLRIGHPARILTSIQNHTLDHISTHSDSGQLLSDVRQELSTAYASLYTPKDQPSAGNKSTSRRGTSSQHNKRVTGSERKKLWEEVRALRAELKKRERGLFTQTIDDANVVMATLHGAAGGVLQRSINTDKRGFDTVIVDEACQALEASIWGAVLDKGGDGETSPRVILAGDHQQLGPVVKSSEKGKKAGKKAVKSGKASNKKEVKSMATSKANGRATATDLSTSMDGQLTVQGDDSEHDSCGDGDGDGDSDGDGNGNSSDTAAQHSAPTLRPPRTLSTTLFTRLLSLYGPGLKSLLHIQYRMNSLIMEYPNQALYEGKLIAHESCKDSWVGDGRFTEWKGGEGQGVMSSIDGGRVVFFDTAGSELYEDGPTTDGSPLKLSSTDSKSNKHEVQLIHTHLTHLLSLGIPSSSITILAPYNAQINLLSSFLSTSDIFSQLEIGTIDALQGREKDVVFISLTRSNEVQEVGFLAEFRRLNVAMTRAKRMLVVVGDSETVRMGGVYLRDWMDWLDTRAVVEPVLPL